MRIIGGIHRSRTILGPRDDRTTRPITDRVKQSLFDRLTIFQALEGNALDIFSGTGSLGLEALSRGVDHVTFVEKDRGARELLNANLEALKLREQAAVLGVDAMAASWMHTLPRRPITLVFLDPPYRMTTDEASMQRIADLIRKIASVVEPGGVLSLRTDEHAKPLAAEGWEGPQTHPFGSMALHFYFRQGVAGEEGGAENHD